MRALILAPGSRGDVQPYIALGAGLVRAGHTATVVTTMDHEALVKSYQLPVVCVPIDVQRALQSTTVSGSLEGGGVITSFRQMAQIAARASRMMAELALEAAREVDVIVTGFGGAFLAEAIARRVSKPLVQAYNVPLTSTASFPGALTPGLDFGPRSRRLGHALTRLAVWMTARMSGNRARMEVLGAERAPLFPGRTPGLVAGPVVYGFSEAFLPRGAEWGPDVEVTGFWFTDDPPDFVAPPHVESFLREGPPPIAIGFGSMSQTNPRAVTALVLEAVKQAEVRAVLLAGWGELKAADLPSTVLSLDGLPHSWLYPRCRAVVHHGGAGTTAAALKAGVPAVVVPFHGDQPFWASRVRASGVGPAAVPRRQLTVKRLAQALRESAQSQALADAARALGEKIRAEAGVDRAVEAIARLAR